MPEGQHNIRIDAVEKDIKNRINSQPPRRPTIFQVQQDRRITDPDSYSPTRISIGPYHRGRTDLENNDIKPDYRRSFILRNPVYTAPKYEVSLRELLKDARACYSFKDQVEVEDFLDMLFTDGAFIIELFLKNHYDELAENTMSIAGVKLDMLRFENQLPFSVLSKLFTLVSSEGTTIPHPIPSLLQLVIEFFTDLLPAGSWQERLNYSHAAAPSHLLHLFHRCATARANNALATQQSSQMKAAEVRRHMWIPRATDLEKAVGVKFKGNKDILLWYKSFKAPRLCAATMEVSYVILDAYNNALFRNLIEFEQNQYLQRNVKSTPVIAYAMLMARLIGSKKDVNLLRLQGVVSTVDRDPSPFFSTMCTHTLLHQDSYYTANLAELSTRVSENYCSKLRRCQTDMWRKINDNWVTVVCSILLGVAAMVISGLGLEHKEKVKV